MGVITLRCVQEKKKETLFIATISYFSLGGWPDGRTMNRPYSLDKGEKERNEGTDRKRENTHVEDKTRMEHTIHITRSYTYIVDRLKVTKRGYSNFIHELHESTHKKMNIIMRSKFLLI